jgi:hypothetical protein
MAAIWRRQCERGGASLTRGGEFVPIARVKYVLPALVAVVCALAACETTADRRDLFAPNKPQGPYTDMLHGKPAPVVAQNGPQPPQAAGLPLPPPPPPPPPPSTTPETDAGAPAATPMPGTATPGSNASSTLIPGTSAPVTTPSSGSEPLAVPPPAVPAATPAPETGTSPPPVIPGLSQ